MYYMKNLLLKTIELKASDLHLIVGSPPIVRINGNLEKIGEENLISKDVEKFAKEVLSYNFEKYIKAGEYDSSFVLDGIGRFRVNVFKEKNNDAIAIRVINFTIPTLEELKYPKIIKELTRKRRGLVLVTGPTGCGKSTTLASMINEINNTRNTHIITLEDPIEYLHKHKKSIINQREIGKDSKSYKNALKAILREDPDVILIGEMRDFETISIAITAAETGHLVFSTLHTIGAAKTIDRIIDSFPSNQQQQIRTQLATVLQGIISQQLLPELDGRGRIAASEIMTITPGIQKLIREGKTYQIQSIIQTGSRYGMKTMDMSIAELYKSNIISNEIALEFAVEKETLERIVML
ncbi:type IV pilus twitching motility protein PilT [Clostridium sp. SHJSY1]|uniref:type IV pilus twitching motility protein PilT n=1 Tax=Clostridium sp. SHJSY1 TaxID=2942483 RepID=UPI002875508F|nr:type IV pilus twitching motility protein PilT [Clostridium sp. SHJSY1]MDS0524974.1 type IV pilus twitching motility protein PilT [Clostridium sp. SHJSY1]